MPLFYLAKFELFSGFFLLTIDLSVIDDVSIPMLFFSIFLVSFGLEFCGFGGSVWMCLVVCVTKLIEELDLSNEGYITAEFCR